MSLPPRQWSLPVGGEFRFEVLAGRSVEIRLLEGTAEAMGMELCIGIDYQISGPAKCAVFTFDGARLSVATASAGAALGAASAHAQACEVEYVSTENDGAMHAYLNTHLAMEQMRNSHHSRRALAPRILVLGTSRSTVARVLTNYAVRAGRKLLLVDADPSSGSVLIPGVLAAHLITRPLSFADGWWGVSAGDGQPCAYFYGSASISGSEHAHVSAQTQMRHYRRLLARLAFAVNGRLATAVSASSIFGGAIIVAPAEVDEQLAGEMQEMFQADMVLVVGNERLHATVERAMKSVHARGKTSTAPIVLKLPRSSGVVSRDANYRRMQVQAQLSRFFHGSHQEYSPFSIVISFDDVSIRKLGEDELAPKSALPLGATRKLGETRAGKVVDPSSVALLYSILAIPWAASEEELIESNIAGFIHVTSVDESKRQITALSTCPGAKLPSPFLLLGSLKWIDR